MKICRFVTTGALSLLAVTAIVAQQPAAPAAGTDHVAAIKQSLQQSAAALRQYQWVETTTVSMKGEQKSQTQANCYWGADGVLQKTPVTAPPPEKKKRGLRGKAAENKKEEISDATTEATALVKQYVPPDPALIQAAKDTGRLTLTPPDPTGKVVVVIKDYRKPGDSLTIVLNVATSSLASLAVATYTDSAKDAVKLNVTFGTLADGTVYQPAIQLDVASQSLGIAIQNTGYKKLGG